MNSQVMSAMRDELEKISAATSEKDAGFSEMISKAKDVLTTPIPGTQPWLLGHADAARQGLKRSAGSVGSVTKKLTGQGGYDVSHMAHRMGLS